MQINSIEQKIVQGTPTLWFSLSEIVTDDHIGTVARHFVDYLNHLPKELSPGVTYSVFPSYHSNPSLTVR